MYIRNDSADAGEIHGTFETSPYDFSVNFTIEDLVNEETIAYLVNESRYRQLSSRLIVEIVETEEMKDFERIVSILADLRKEGIRIAIDDFGSGYSSFEYILKLNPSFIKIDRVITQSILSDQRAYGIMKSVIEFARHSGIQTVAEYVDSAELRDTVVTLGVDYIQGWLVGNRSLYRIETVTRYAEIVSRPRVRPGNMHCHFTRSDSIVTVRAGTV
jgi:EAL domain-containing protein (putative c-di-GMP-specific phosphodiesterase class I)